MDYSGKLIAQCESNILDLSEMKEINNKENSFLEPNKSQLLKLLKAIND